MPIKQKISVNVPVFCGGFEVKILNIYQSFDNHLVAISHLKGSADNCQNPESQIVSDAATVYVDHELPVKHYLKGDKDILDRTPSVKLLPCRRHLFLSSMNFSGGALKEHVEDNHLTAILGESIKPRTSFKS